MLHYALLTRSITRFASAYAHIIGSPIIDTTATINTTNNIFPSATTAPMAPLVAFFPVTADLAVFAAVLLSFTKAFTKPPTVVLSEDAAAPRAES